MTQRYGQSLKYLESSLAGRKPTAMTLVMLLIVGLMTSAITFLNAGAAAAAEPNPSGCGYADSGTGKYADTICWLDMSGYSEVDSRSPAGQPMSITLPGGYKISFVVKTSTPAPVGLPPGGNTPRGVVARDSIAGAWVGSKAYKNIPGNPVLYQNPGNLNQPGGASSIDNGATTVSIQGITVTDSSGNPVSDYGMVSADAEFTANGEQIHWSSDKPLNLLDNPGANNVPGSCGNSLVGQGTTAMSCSTPDGLENGAPDGVIVYATGPTVMTQSLYDVYAGNRDAISFGLLTSKVQVNKAVTSRAGVSDSFTVDAKNAAATVLSSASTGVADSASTGSTTVLGSGPIRLGEVADGTTDLGNYNASWNCLNNGTLDAALSAATTPSQDVTLNVGDFVNCTITNTAKPRQLVIEKTSDSSVTRVGNVVHYTVKASNTGGRAYTAGDPASVIDDLTGVLDDATYNNDAKAAVSAGSPVIDPVLSGSNLTWSGPLLAGESVTITYSVTVKSGGDRALLNTAFAPQGCVAGTPNCTPSTPACATGDTVSCTQTPMPSVSVEKTADKSAVSFDGGSVSYTLTIRNEGPGDCSVETPCQVTDDLSGVTGNGSYNKDAVSSAGSAVLSTDGTKLVWTGPLAAGASATVNYTVNYEAKAKGSHSMINVACVDTAVAKDPGKACATVTVPGPYLVESKSVDPETGTSVKTGQVLSYTLTFDNSTGKAPATVNSADDMSGVIDDASLTYPPASSGPELVVGAVQNGKFGITGTVPAGKVLTVTYKVTVKAEAVRGDSVLANFMAASPKCDSDDPTCLPKIDPKCDTSAKPVLCTKNPVSELHHSKDSDPKSGTAVHGGQELSYTLTFWNTGKGSGVLDEVDDLSQVLDDAVITAEPAASNPALTVGKVENGKFTISGTIPAGAKYTVTYKAKVLSEGRGDSKIGNVLMTVCSAKNQPCSPDTVTTENPVLAYVVAKTVSAESVKPGETLTYKLTMTNTGAVAYTAANPATAVDDLSQVLDDADYKNLAQEGVSYKQPQLTWNSPLAVGETKTISYSVVVKTPDKGDRVLRNGVVPAGPGGNCLPDKCQTSTKVNVPGNDPRVPLAFTGSTGVIAFLLVGALGVAGGIMLLTTRRRRTK